MRLAIKKVIAREFLILALVAFVGLTCFLSTFLYNSARRHQAEGIKADIAKKTTLSDSLSISYTTKVQNQEWYFMRMNNEFDLGEFNTPEKWWTVYIELAKNDSINILWEGIWNEDESIIGFFNGLGFANGDSLQTFITENTIDELDLKNKKKSEDLQRELVEIRTKEQNIASSIMTYKEQLSFLKNVLFFLVIVLFVIRYIYYGVKWSLKTLKQKDE